MDDKRNKSTSRTLNMEFVSLIADTIKKSDTSYFFENYTKQAIAVLKVLDKKGYVLVPKNPTKEMIKAGVYAISVGSIDAKQLAKDIYTDMIEADD